MISSLSSLVFVFYPGFQEPHDAPWDKGLYYFKSQIFGRWPKFEVSEPILMEVGSKVSI